MIKNLKRLFKYFEPSRKQLIVVGVLVVISTFFSILGPIILSGIIDNYIDAGKAKGFILILGVLLSVYVMSDVCNFISSFIMVKASEQVVYDLRKDLFNHIIKMPISFFDKNKKGDIMSRFTNDLTDINDVLSDVVVELISGVIILIGSLVFMFILSPMLTFITLGISLVSFICTIYIGMKTATMFTHLQNNIGKISGFSEEMISSMPIIKQYGKEKETNDKFAKMSNRFRHYSVKANLYASLMMPVSVTVTNLGHMLIVGIGAILIIKGHTTVGSILAFITYFDMIKKPINQVASLFASVTSALAGVNRIFKVMDESIEDPSGKQPEIKGEIEFKNVSFGYNEKEVIKNLNLKIKKGETIAIVGPTGAGKTTILNLVNKFYLPNKGEVLIDGISTKELAYDNLRKSIGLVAQEPYLFKGTIKENLYYNELRDKEKIKSIGLNDMIEKFPSGYDFIVEDSGDNIATGEKQLLTVARTALLNPKILLLDEATSSVDVTTEKFINEGLKKIIKDRTTIIVAHRLSTTKNADRIIVIDKGQIVEEGNHKTLLKKKGLYYNLYNSGLE